jgi:hypothetical protein
MKERGTMWWTGVAISVTVVLFLLMDAGAKLAAIRPVLEAGEQIGFRECRKFCVRAGG